MAFWQEIKKCDPPRNKKILVRYQKKLSGESKLSRKYLYYDTFIDDKNRYWISIDPEKFSLLSEAQDVLIPIQWTKLNQGENENEPEK